MLCCPLSAARPRLNPLSLSPKKAFLKNTSGNDRRVPSRDKSCGDRLWFKDACRKIGWRFRLRVVNNAQDAMRLCEQLGFPLVIRPSFTLGGTGGAIAYNREELASPFLTRWT